MVKGKTVSSDIQRIVVWLSAHLSKEDISTYTGVSHRTVQQILQHFEETGAIPDEEKERQRSQVLHDEDVNVSMPASGAVLQLLINHLVEIHTHSRDS